MNKSELVSYVADSINISKKEAKEVVQAVIDGIVDGIINDGKVNLVGFGTFTAVKREARTARNPQTGEEVEVPEKFVPKFKPSTVLKESVANIEGSEEEDDDE